MSGHRATEEEIVAVEVEMADAITRVWRESLGYWWAELWRREEPNDPPSPFESIEPEAPTPLDPPGFVLMSCALKTSRRAARKEARRMREIYALARDPSSGHPWRCRVSNAAGDCYERDTRVTSPQEIRLRIVADTRDFRRQLARVRLTYERSWWQRLRLKFEIWRIAREKPPA